MKITKCVSRILALPVLMLLIAQTASSQDDNEPSTSSASTAAPGTSLDKSDILKVTEQVAVRKVFNKAEVGRYCAKHAGQLIAYYGDVFKVERCTRRRIENSKTLARMIAKGAKVHDVDGDVVAAIPEGESLDNDLIRDSLRTCKELNKNYVSYSSVDVYYVEKCKRRLMPDWTTYIKHRDERGDERGEIIALSWEEFTGIEEGQPVPSVVDDMFARLLAGEADIDIIPVDEACAGVNGKVVTYYDKMYQIEKCRRREILDPGTILQPLAMKRSKFIELSSQQWLSLPEGAPVGKKKDNGPKPAGKS